MRCFSCLFWSGDWEWSPGFGIFCNCGVVSYICGAGVVLDFVDCVVVWCGLGEWRRDRCIVRGDAGGGGVFGID